MKSHNDRPDRTYLFGSFRVEVKSQQLLRDGTPVTLPTRKAFETLLTLVSNHNRIVKKDELLTTVWRDAFVSDDSLTQCISMIRRALDDDPVHPQFVATIPRQGYRFIAPVSVIGDVSVPEVVAAPPSKPSIEPPGAKMLRAGETRGWVIAGTVALAVGVFAVTWTRTEGPDAPIHLFHVAPPGTALTSGGVLAPNGTQIAFIARSRQSGLAQLWIRDLGAGEARALPGTDRATRPFWAPDSKAIAFFADGKLKRADLQPATGVVRPPVVLASVGYAPAGGSWGVSGDIVFATRTSRVHVVPASGGIPTPVTALDKTAGEIAHRWPQFLPDGRHFLYLTEGSSSQDSTTYVASLDSQMRVPLLKTVGSPAFFAAPNYLLYVRDGVLMAQRFDLRALKLDGAAIAIASNVTFPTLTNGGVVSAARGLLAIWGGPADRRLVWFSRDGQRTGVIEAPTALHNPAFSPDDRQLVAQGDTDRPGLWLIDLDRSASMNFVSEGVAPIWSPGGERIAFSAATPDGRELRVLPVKTSGAPDILLHMQAGSMVAADWSTDGRFLLVSVGGTADSRDVWILRADGSGGPQPYLHSPANEVQSRIAPSGEWVAYASDESGVWEVYVESFPVPGVRRVISVGGGAEPQWRRDGNELFYVAADGTLMVVDIQLGEELRVGSPKALFRTPLSGDISSYRNRYAVTSDGGRFLIDATEPPEVPALEIIVNWTSLFAR